ncbi:MAG: hypothetical protein KKA19_06825 [Candidatus Margulisbacteria bacterium]|nr:hypothetical protein [Candidatus Margulisiibacteriota bacterium]
MKKIYLVILIFIVAITIGCGKATEEITDNSSPSTPSSPSSPSNPAGINESKEVDGAGALRVTFNVFGDFDPTVSFKITKVDSGEIIVTFDAKGHFDVENIAQLSGLNPGETARIWTVLYKPDGMGSSSRAASEWDFTIPTTNKDIVYENFCFAPRFQMYEGQYLDVSNLEIADSASIDWDIRQPDVDDNKIVTLEANAGCGIYISSSDIVNQDVSGLNYQSSGIFRYGTDRVLIIKTKEGKYARVYCNGYSSNTGFFLMRYEVYYYNDGSSYLHDPGY